MEATADDKINTICMLPERASSPKTETFDLMAQTFVLLLSQKFLRY
jgi:hypothetical protein